MSSTLRVLHLAKHAPPVRGGIETVVGELISELRRDRRGTDTTFLCYADRSAEDDLDAGVVLRRCRIVAKIASAPLSIAMCRAYLGGRKAADIIHVHVPNPWAVLLVLVCPPHGRVIVSAHAASTRYGILQVPHDLLMRSLYQRAAAVVVSARSNIRHLGLDHHRGEIRIVPYGISADRFVHPADRRAESATVLFVGRLVYYKGVDILIDAAVHLDASVIVLGDGPLHADLVRRRNENGLDARIRFVRDADDEELRRHLADCTVFVLPSTTTSEFFGLAMLEALASGVPVVVSGLGTGLDEVVRTSDAGIVVPPGDPAALAAAITRLLSDPAERDRLGRNGRATFARRYTAARMVDELVSLYRDAQELKVVSDADRS